MTVMFTMMQQGAGLLQDLVTTKPTPQNEYLTTVLEWFDLTGIRSIISTIVRSMGFGPEADAIATAIVSMLVALMVLGHMAGPAQTTPPTTPATPPDKPPENTPPKT